MRQGPYVSVLKGARAMNKNLKISALFLSGCLFLSACSSQPGGTNATTTTNTATNVSQVATTTTPEPPASTETPAGTETPDATGTPSGSPTPGETSTPAEAKSGKLEPLEGVTDAPPIKKVVKIKMKTDAGDIAMEIYPEAAPNAAKRFEELVKAGFYDNTPLFRVVPGFVVQFGVNSDPKHVTWKEKNFNDDPSYYKLSEGTLAFAKAGPNTNSTQVFINYGDNSQLASQAQGGFTAFGKVTSGMDVVKKFKQVGDPSMGLDQEALWKDTQGYLKGLPEKPNMIVKAEVVK